MPTDDTYTKVLLHFEGNNAGTSFIDESGKPWSAAGNAQTSTTQYKFGLTSGKFDGSGDYISTPDNTDFALSNGDWTVDMWIYPTNNAFCGFFAQSSDVNTASVTSIYFGRNFSTEVFRGSMSNGTTIYHVTSTTTLTSRLNTWTHIALERYGTNIMIYVNGTKEGTTAVGTSTVPDSSSSPIIGALLTSNYYYTGYIDEFRFSKTSRYLGNNFNVPTLPYYSGGAHNAYRGRYRNCGSVDPKISGYHT